MKLRFLHFCFALFLLLINANLSAQVTLTLRVNSGNSTTTCTDGFFGGGPEPHWRVEVAGQGYTTYPRAGICFTNTPNTQYNETFNCPSGYPNSLQVCLRAFEDDGTACVVGQSCLTQRCQNFATPAPGNSITYNLNVGGASTANVNFTITASGAYPPGSGYDQICNAINLGTLNSSNSVGNSNLSNYGNFCAGNAGDPNAWGGNNDQGVWFQFTTGPMPAAVIEFDANSDPQNFGDGLDLQLAVYESSNGTCSGALTLIEEEYQGIGVAWDEDMSVNCMQPNTTYFVLVDGEAFTFVTNNGVEGFFGLQVNDNGVQQAGDEICDAENLGTVPVGGSVATPNLSRSNVCASNINDPTPGAWGSDQTVWFMFQAPPSGHVYINADSDLPFPFGTDAIDLQLALYGTSNGTCTGVLDPIYSDYTPIILGEEMDVRCLTPGENYWVMVDGATINVSGIFDLSITDGGQYPAPNDLICDAIPLGQPAPGGTVGLTGQYNYCANNLFEPIPANWGNDQGVWYTFIAPPSGKVEIRLNDYGLLSPDRIDLQVVVYDLTGAVCSGVPTEIKSEHDGIGIIWDEDMWVDCLIPGREYWIMVDGEGSLIDPDLREGIFDIEVYGDPQDPPAANDEACNAIALGDPTGGAVSTTPTALHGSQNNFCADALGEPQPSNFTADQTVWYTFVAPATGAVNFDLNSDAIVGGVDAINLQIAVYKTPGCAGPWIEEVSGSDLTYDVDLDLWCLVPGETYYVQIDGEPPVLLEGHEGYFDITITEIPPIPVSPNDTICGAIALGNPWTSGPITLTNQHNLCADDLGDPNPTAFGTDNTVWYTFTTPATGGPFALDIQATSDLPWPFGTDAVDLQLAVFESSNNTCTGSLTEMTSEYSLLDLFNEFMNVRCLEENKTYFLMVDGSILNVQGYFDLNLTSATPVPIPTNDLICNHINLGTVPVGGSINNGIDYSNFCSDIEAGEPNPFAIEQTVWFSFVAPNHVGLNATSDVTINVTADPGGIGDVLDLQLAVYESSNTLCTGTMNLLEDGDSDPIASFDASVSVTCLYPGQRYYVQVDGSILNQEGYFRIDIQDDGQGVRPPYNMMCNALNLGTVPNGGTINNNVNYTNLCSDTEPGEPNPSAFGIEKTAWFSFVAPASGNITINGYNDPNNVGDEIDLQLAVYYSDDNTCTGNFLEVDSDYDLFNKDEELNVDCLEGGRIYYLQVDGSGGLTGDEDGWFTLQISDDGGTSNAPYNNNICDAFSFGTPTGTLQTRSNESNVCSNVEVGEPGVGAYATHTVWYQFTAPPSGRIEINVTSTNLLLGMDPEVRIFASSTNTCTGTLSEVERSFWPTALITENIEATCLIPGNQYFIQVDGSNLVLEGTFNINIIDLIPTYGTGVASDPQPSNDSCDNAIMLPVQSESCLNGAGTFQTNNYGYPTITYNPAYAQGCGGNCGDTWYQFTMPATGNAVIEGNDDAVGGTFGDYSELTVVAYTGTCNNLTPIDCGQGGPTSDVSYQIAAAPGTTIWLQVFNEDGDDVGEDYQICVSEGCGFDDCLDALLVPMLPNIPYCWNTSGAEGEDIANGAPGYDECSEGDNPENSVYYYFESDCNGSDVTLHIMNGQINGSCILGITPTDGFNISLFQDATPCDNIPNALVDCQSFTACDVQPINWNFTYTGLAPNTPYVIQIDGGFGNAGGNNQGEVMITTTVNPILEPVSTPLTCSGTNDGTASAAVLGGGVPPFTFLWSNGGIDSTIIGLASGIYTVTITGANGCTDTASVFVDDGLLMTAAALPPTNASCHTVCDGQATVLGIGGTVTTGYTYLWDAAAGSQTTATVTNLCAGTYSVTVSDNAGCSDSTQIIITEPDSLVINLTNIISSGCDSLLCAGSATAVVTGGSAVYTYLWSNGNTNAIPVDLCPGFNAVTVTDAQGCSDSTSIIITTPIASTPPIINPLTGSFCPNTTVNLVATGGIVGTGAITTWYTGPNGTGAFAGVGNSINIITDTTTTYYVRREGACGNTVDSSITVIVKQYIYALDGTSTNTYCTDNNGWHHFFVGDDIILSVQGDITTGAMPGFPLVTIWDSTNYYQESEGPFGVASCATGWSPGEERFEMERSWNVDLGGGAVNAPYNVRFYYEPTERIAIETAATNWMATYPACGYSYKYPYPLGSYFFKNEGANYDAPVYDSLHLTGPIGTTINGVNYGELQNINSFSGGSIGLILIPIDLLPVDWLYFDGTTDNKVNFLTWGTETEDNTAYFNIERSRDGFNFEKIGQVNAQGQSIQTAHYTFDDVNPFEGANYYRLELVDLDGTSTYSNIVLLSIEQGDLAYNFYPNPTDGFLYYQYQADNVETLEVKVMDVLGKLIAVQEHKTVVGTNNIPTDLNDYPPGTYIVRVHHKKTGYVHIAKVIKNKF